MTEYRKDAHSVWDLKYHLIWVTKYRYEVLRGEVATRTRDLLRQICQGREVVIVQGAVSPDHVYILVSVPPQLAPAKLVQYLKGRSSQMLQDEFPQLKKRSGCVAPSLAVGDRGSQGSPQTLASLPLSQQAHHRHCTFQL
jgi:putative transposase